MPRFSKAKALLSTALVLCLALSMIFTGFGSQTKNIVQKTDYALKDVYKDYFLVSAAINGYSIETAAINHPSLAAILKKHFNSTTLSNLMKPQYLLDYEATKKNKDKMPVCKFDSCIPSLEFCKKNGIKMRGHTLVWPNQTPEWFFHVDYDVSKPYVDARTIKKEA